MYAYAPIPLDVIPRNDYISCQTMPIEAPWTHVIHKHNANFEQENFHR
jgi:hypothetical protein